MGMDMPPELRKIWELQLLEELQAFEELGRELGRIPARPVKTSDKIKQRIIDVCERIIEWASK